ncbi:hypothetical protein ACU4I5_10795 [Ensifer adhaerens]
MEPDLRARVVALEQKASDTERRLSGMEQWRQQSDLTDARKDEQWKNLLEKFGLMDRKIDTVDTSLNKKMDELGGNIRWLGKIVIGAALSAMVAGVVAFMMKGDLISHKETGQVVDLRLRLRLFLCHLIFEHLVAKLAKLTTDQPPNYCFLSPHSHSICTL